MWMPPMTYMYLLLKRWNMNLSKYLITQLHKNTLDIGTTFSAVSILISNVGKTSRMKSFSRFTSLKSTQA